MSNTTLSGRAATLRVAFAGASDSVGALREALDAPGSGFDVACSATSAADLPADLEEQGSLAAVLLDLASGAAQQSEMALREAVTAARRASAAPVILLVPEARPDILAWAVATEVEDVLVLPQSPETLGFAIRKARRSAASRGSGAHDASVKRGRIVTVFSPKGGTGKTVLTTNLAAYLAARTDKKVLLIDLDLQFGDAAIMLGLDPERTLFTLVRDPGELDAGKLSAYLTKHRSGLDVLAAPLRPEEAELVTETKVTRLLEIASEVYDIVLVDTSPFFYGPMLALLDPTDELLLLCGLDVPTLKNVGVSLRTMEQLGFSRSRSSLVLNRVAPDVGLSPEDVEAALGVPVRFEIPNDPGVAPAVNRGSAAVLADRDSEFAAAVEVVARSIAGIEVTEAPDAAATVRRRWLQPRRFLEGRTT